MLNRLFLLILTTLMLTNIDVYAAKGGNSTKGGGNGGSGGGSYNCKNDKQLEQAMTFEIDDSNPANPVLTAFGGSDKSGDVHPYKWYVEGEAGRGVMKFPSGLYGAYDNLRVISLEALNPNTEYTISLDSADLCLNVKRFSITYSYSEGGVISDSTGPVIHQGPEVEIANGFFGSSVSIARVFAQDEDSAIKSVTFRIYDPEDPQHPIYVYTTPDYQLEEYHPYMINTDGILGSYNTFIDGPQFVLDEDITPFTNKSYMLEVIVEDTAGNTSTASSPI